MLWRIYSLFYSFVIYFVDVILSSIWVYSLLYIIFCFIFILIILA